MAGIIDNYLKKYGLTRYEVAKITGVHQSTLNRANDKPLESITYRTLNYLAVATARKPWQVLRDLEEAEGNPIIKFIENHPDLDPKLVNHVEDLMIELREMGVEADFGSFNRYEQEANDSIEAATQLLENLADQLEKFKIAFKNGDFK